MHWEVEVQLHDFLTSTLWSYSWSRSLQPNMLFLLRNSRWDRLYGWMIQPYMGPAVPDSMKQSPSGEADSRSVSTEIPRLLRNPKVHCRVHNSPHWSLSWARWIQSTPSHRISLRPILILSSHLSQVFRMVSFLHAFQPKFLYISRLPMRARCPAHPQFDLPIIYWRVILQIMEPLIISFSSLLSLHPS
jgi:hypothetical protein